MPDSRRPSHARAALVLAQRDPVLASLVSAAGPPRLRPPLESHFAALARSILYQQLAGSAAAAIHARLVTALGGSVTPEAVLAVDQTALRDAGLSRAKADSLRDLAARVTAGTLELDPRRIARLDDEELIARLSAVRGVGRWTAQMFLLFQLRRLDVWPSGDLGVRRGFGLAWDRPMPSARELEPLGELFRPYRSVAAWYCWRACELLVGAGESALTS